MIPNLAGIDYSFFIVLVMIVFFSVMVYTSIVDLYINKIPNFLTVTLAGIGIFYNYSLFENAGLMISLYGLMTGFIVSLFFHQFAALGAGDVKFFAAIGTLVGYQSILLIIAYSYVISAFLGIGYLKLWLPYQSYSKTTPNVSKQQRSRSTRIPMAPGICIATCYEMFSRFIEN